MSVGSAGLKAGISTAEKEKEQQAAWVEKIVGVRAEARDEGRTKNRAVEAGDGRVAWTDPCRPNLTPAQAGQPWGLTGVTGTLR